MILNDKKIQEVITVGENKTQIATINQDKIAKLQYLLTNGLYSDGVGSTIVEITNNALDSIIQAGKDPMENPVYVYIERNLQGNYQLRIVDNGLGLDEDEFQNIVMNYLTSTKEDSDDVIGAFGIGAKSWCSVSNTATFICRKNGVERTFLCYRGQSFITYDKVHEKPTEEENGVTFILPILDYMKRIEFERKAKQKLCYYDNVILTISGLVIDNKIYRAKEFQWSTLNSNQYLHLSLKDVYYQLDFEALGIEENIYIPICMRFGLNEGIMPTPSRENIIYTEKTIQLFKDKIQTIAEWFRNKYNETIKDYETLMEAYDHIDTDTKYVTVEGTDLEITSLLKYAKLEVNEIKIQGIELRPPIYYKKKIEELLFEYKEVAYLNNNGTFAKAESKFPSLKKHLLDEKTVVLLVEAPVGQFKTFLGEKYPCNTLFVTRSKKRKLGYFKSDSKNSYVTAMELKFKERDQWRAQIKEWQYVQKTVERTFEDASMLWDSEEFKEWQEERKLRQKERNKGRGNSKYNSLNKQKGEITVAKARMYKHGGKAVFDRFTEPINTLHKKDKLTVYFTKNEAAEDMSEDGQDFIYYALKSFSKDKVRFVWLNDREIKFVKDLKNWKTKEEFMFSKPLRRYVTAHLIHDYLNMVPDVHQDIINATFPKYKAMHDQLLKYQEDNATDGSDELFKELKDLMVTENLYDMEIYPLFKEFQNIIEMFGFLNYMENLENYHESEPEAKAIRNIIYIMLKNRKVTGKGVDDFKLVPVDKEPIPENEIAYWQPKLRKNGEIVGKHYSYYEKAEMKGYEVWLSKDALLAKYPTCTPVPYREGDIEDYEIQDPESRNIVNQVIDEDEDTDNNNDNDTTDPDDLSGIIVPENEEDEDDDNYLEEDAEEVVLGEEVETEELETDEVIAESTPNFDAHSDEDEFQVVEDDDDDRWLSLIQHP